MEPVIVGAVAGVMCMNITVSAMKGWEYNKDVEEFRRAIRLIPPHSAVFVSSADEEDCPAPAVEGRFYTHMASLVTIDRDSIQPYIFAHRGAELAYYKPEFKGYFSPIPISPVDGALAAMMVTNDLTPLASGGLYRGYYHLRILPFMDKWNERFPYVIHLTMGCTGDTPYSRLFHEVARGRSFVIYRTER